VLFDTKRSWKEEMLSALLFSIEIALGRELSGKAFNFCDNSILYRFFTPFFILVEINNGSKQLENMLFSLSIIHK
jgi:hypothetical protein